MPAFLNCINQPQQQPLHPVVRGKIHHPSSETLAVINRRQPNKTKCQLLAFTVMFLFAQYGPMLPAQAQRIDADTLSLNTSNYTLSPKAREAAVLLGILPKVERLLEIKRAKADGSANTLTDEELGLKVDILDRVLGGSLEVRMVAGRIDRELAWAYAGHDMLQARRQRNLNMIFTANFMQIGVLGTLSGPYFLRDQAKTGTELLLLASSIGLLFSTLSLIESRSGTKKLDGGSTILADVFHIDANDKPDHRIEIITNYLNAVPPNSADKKTRIDTLVTNWKKGKYLTSESKENLEKLAAVQPAGKRYRENIPLLTKRIRMLFDTQFTIELLHEELLDLLRTVETI
ncbi:MAG: hypothetical protein IPJ49_13345 [Candidatus Obscuribacter sp.]|jgi:hypothetical protein|nr:hypothetical protein [Candidatus Obscuribacter sp.]